MQSKFRFTSLRPLFLVFLAALLVFGCSEKADLGTNNPDPDPEPNPVVPLKSAVLTSDNIIGVVSAQVSETFLMTYSPNGTVYIPVAGFGEQIATGTLVVNHPASMLDASGPYVIFGDSMAVYVAKRDAATGDYKTIFGLEAPTFGERFSHVAIDGVQIAIVSKRSPRSFFVRTFEIDYNGSFIAGGALDLIDFVVVKAQAFQGRLYLGAEHGSYLVDTYDMRVLSGRSIITIAEKPMLDFDIDGVGRIFTCSKISAAMYDAFGNRTKITDDGKDFRKVSASPNGVLHVQEGNSDISVFIPNLGERKKIHYVDPNPIAGINAFGGIGDVAVLNSGIWNLWDWDTGLAKTSAVLDSTGTQPPPPIQWGMIQLQTPADLKKLKFTEAKQ